MFSTETTSKMILVNNLDFKANDSLDVERSNCCFVQCQT